MSSERGFTLVEFVVAMAVFSFMLIILVAGFLNVLALHNASVAQSGLQDNAQLLLATIEREIRDSDTATPVTAAGAVATSSTILCLDHGSTLIEPGGAAPFQLVQKPALNCVAVAGTTITLTTGNIQLFFLGFINETTATSITRPSIYFSMRMGTKLAASNFTAAPYDVNTSCLPAQAKRGFCQVATYQDVATPRGIN
jgi:prepilin-type N-terminal cleavage/methylation domain-containing protein